MCLKMSQKHKSEKGQKKEALFRSTLPLRITEETR